MRRTVLILLGLVLAGVMIAGVVFVTGWTGSGPAREDKTFTLPHGATLKDAGAELEKAGITPDDVDWVICHQANVRILDASIRRLGMPAEKFYRNLDRYANTSAASIPLALDEMREKGLLQSGQRIILVGFEVETLSF